MGVPKFFRWISERYPCLSQLVKGYDIPEFDNLYLDMNGIIHQCSHPDDDNIHFRMSEEKMFTDIFHYIDFLFRLIKPQKVFFMAIDGVAPRAKMNQQRSRRFRSAKDAEVAEKKAIAKGEELPTEARFDSNCITPGTPFMTRLQEALMKFTEDKVTRDPLWRGVKVVLSGHQTPGEGEHKIMEFIRFQRTQPDFDPKTRHCLYGLDADLIMLGLTSHQPHFSLLREEVRFGKKEAKKFRPNVPEDINFFLLHLSLLRDYIDLEFQSLRSSLSFGYNLERVIDDWILLGFLVGNDFIPHLPNLHIHQDALPMLWNTYKKVLPVLQDYLHDNGFINFANLENFFVTLSQYDKDVLEEQCADFKWLQGKTGEKMAEQLATLGVTLDVKPAASRDIRNPPDVDELRELEPFQYGSDISISDDDDDWMDSEMSMMKRDYYTQKLGKEFTEDERRSQTYGYVKGLQWILHYYYHGVPSWGWFYPQHYAPFISDIKDFGQFKVEFDLGKPFQPFQQLMAVLPAASKSIIPPCYHHLMTDANSPIINFYPPDFETDMNGKKQEWEAVVLIPFINEKQLLDAMAPIESHLTDDEKSRNKHGCHLQFSYNPSVLKAVVKAIPPDGFRVPAHLAPPPIPSATFFPGFPVLKHVRFTAELKQAKVKVFQQASRTENMVLSIDSDEVTEEDIDRQVKQMLGKPVFVDWPHLTEVLPLFVVTEKWVYSLEEDKNKGNKIVTRIPSEKNDVDFLGNECKILKEAAFFQRGVFCGSLDCLIRAKPLQGRQLTVGSDGTVTLEKQWASNMQPYLWQRVVTDLTFSDLKPQKLADIMQLGESAFVIGQEYYGSHGNICGLKGGRVTVELQVVHQPDLSRIKTEDHYLSCFAISERVGVNSHFISRITGSVFIKLKDNPVSDDHSPKKFPPRPMNVGLNLKLNKTGLEVAGWTKKDAAIGWMYSPKIVDLIHEYEEKFPLLYRYLASHPSEDDFSADRIWGDDPVPVQEIADFLKQLPCASAERVPIGGAVLSDTAVREISKELEKQQSKLIRSVVKKDFKPAHLFLSLSQLGHCLPDPSVVFHLLDRVVICRMGLTVPFGLRGIVIGIQTGAKESESLLEVIFDEDFHGSIQIRNTPHCYRVPAYTVINFTHGERFQSRYNKASKQQQMAPVGVQEYNPTGYSEFWQSLQQQNHVHHHQNQLHNQRAAHQQRKPNVGYGALQQQTVMPRQNSFDFNSLVNALSGDAQRPPEPPNAYAQDEQAEALIHSLCAEWEWPPPHFSVKKIRNYFTVTISFPNGFVLTSESCASKAEAKFNVAYQLRDYCSQLAGYNSNGAGYAQAQPAVSNYKEPEAPSNGAAVSGMVPHKSYKGIYQAQPQHTKQLNVSEAKKIENELHSLLGMNASSSKTTAKEAPKTEQQKKPAKTKPPSNRLAINFGACPSSK